jgi:hypothetical protein
MIVETHELRPMARPPRRAWAAPAIASVVALTIAIGGVVGAYLVNGRGAGAGVLATWAPTDAAIYAEVDLRLPGAQRANLTALLDHWPALNPDLLLGDEFAAWLDDLLGQEITAPVSYADDLSPWLSGTFALVMRDWPAYPAADSRSMRSTLPEVGFVIGSRDDAAAEAFATKLRGLAEEEEAVSFVSTDHGGVTIWSLEAGPGSEQSVTTAEVAYAVTDGALVVATGADEVARMLDTHAGGASLATSEEAARVVAALPADRIGLSVIDSRAQMQLLVDQLTANAPELGANLEAYLAGTPPLTAAALSIEADRVVATSAAAAVEGPLAFRPLSEPLAERVPAGSLFYASVASVGPSATAGIDAFVAALSADEVTQGMAEQWLAAFESETGVAPRDLFNWAGDMAIYAGWSGTEPVGGMIALTDDPAAASAQLDALVDAVADIAGASIEVERDGSLTQLTGNGMPIVEIVVGDDAVTITVGAGEAARLAAVERGTSLAGEARPSTAMAALGGAATDPSVWLDLAGIVDTVTAQLPAGDALSPERMVIANLEPLDHLVAVTRTVGGITVTRIDIVVR